jgi:putative ABC transport system permease protein
VASCDGERDPVSLLAGTFRGVRRRAGVSLGILLVATVAAAAAAAGPTYDGAARASILQDNLHNTAPIERTVEAASSGPVAGLAENLSAQVTSGLAAQLGGLAVVNRLFQPPVQAILAQVITGNHLTPLTWRTDACTHLRLTAGFCPHGAGQVLVSTSYARLSHVRPGDTIATSSGYGRLMVTGEYAAPSGPQLGAAYWLTGPCDDFIFENPACLRSPPPWDAMFTSAATFASAPDSEQGSATVLDVLTPGSVRPEDLPVLNAAVNELLTDPTLQGMGAVATSSIPQLTDQIGAGWQTLDVPVFLITCQLLLLTWLLLFLIATDAAEARSGEVALAKLRGHGRLRTLAFGLSEPVLLLAAAFPAGALAGWAATAGLARILLRPGTPVGLPVLAIAAAAAATLGGFVAIVLAARRVLVRPVIEQWQHTARSAANRGWVLDAVLLTGALAGLAELIIGGHVTSARSGSLGLLVPGLLGLAAAVVTSRLLPAICGLVFGLTRRHGGTGLFLAVRHIARRPGGTRTTIVLTAAFALATFAAAAFTVAQRNIDRVAAAQTGAAAVLTVKAPVGQDLATIVDRIDPGGQQAAAVDRYAGDTANGAVLLAVQPQRFAQVAQWQSGFLGRPAATLGAALEPSAPPPVTLPPGSGAVRVQVTSQTGIAPKTDLTMWVTEEGSPNGGQTPVSLGALREGWLSAGLTACPCQVSMVTIDTPTVTSGQTQGSVTLSSLDVRTAGTWTPVPAALASAAGWGAGAKDPVGCESTTGQVQAGPGGLRWSFRAGSACSPALLRQDTPELLPALVSSHLTSSLQAFATVGLDGQQLTVDPVALAAAVPGAPAGGIVVDRTYAQRRANFIDESLVAEQVWVAPGSLAAVRAKLTAAGVAIEGVATTAEADAVLMRQGPALASVLFLAAAAAAALLAAGAAVLGLYQAGRRRRYEYAALMAGRVPRRSLRASVLIEQAAVLGFGLVMGVAAGLGSAALVVQNLPEFLSPPAAPPLLFSPPVISVLVVLAIAVVLMAVPAAVSAVALIRSARPELLREVPQ